MLSFLLPQQVSADAGTGLVSHWTLDESSGVRSDATSTNSFTDGNTVGSTAGVISQAASFVNANSEYLQITDASQTGLDFAGDFSINLWMKLRTDPNAQQVLLTKHNNTGNQRAYRIDYDSSANTFIFYISNDGIGWSYDTSIATTPMTTGGFQMVTFRYDASAGQTEIYIDGALYDTLTGLDTSVFNSSAPFGLGTTVISSGDFIIDELSAYNYYITTDVIDDLYCNGDGIALPTTTTCAAGGGGDPTTQFDVGNSVFEVESVVCSGSPTTTCTYNYSTSSKSAWGIMAEATQLSTLILLFLLGSFVVLIVAIGVIWIIRR